MRRYILIITIVFSLSLLVSPISSVSAGEDPNRDALSNLLDELENKITDADKRMIAHPNFLNDLKALVEKFRGKLRKVFFEEDFPASEHQ